jgi:excisionase family DNA binding protein
MENKSRKRRQRKLVIPKSPVILLSVSEIAHRYQFHENTIRRWVSEDGLKSVRYGPGNKIFIAQKDVELFLRRYYEY